MQTRRNVHDFDTDCTKGNKRRIHAFTVILLYGVMNAVFKQVFNNKVFKQSSKNGMKGVQTPSKSQACAKCRPGKKCAYLPAGHSSNVPT